MRRSMLSSRSIISFKSETPPSSKRDDPRIEKEGPVSVGDDVGIKDPTSEYARACGRARPGKRGVATFVRRQKEWGAPWKNVYIV